MKIQKIYVYKIIYLFKRKEMDIPQNWKPLIHIFLETNKIINLSAIRDEEGVFVKHILDSLELESILTFKEGSSVCDVGTWGGFPLLPLAITTPNCFFIGIDSINKKTIAVNNIIQELKIENAKCIWTRAEDHKEQYDYVTARAVGYIDKLLHWTYHLIKKWWFLVLYKLYSLEEKEELQKRSQRNRMKIIAEHKYKLFENDIQRVIYILQK